MRSIQVTEDRERKFIAYYRPHAEWTYNWTPCWHWIGRTSDNGYGILVVKGQFNIGAHRYSYIRSYGDVAIGMVIDHLCERPLCVNPLHLEAVTNAENTQRYHDRRAAREKATDYHVTHIDEIVAMGVATKSVLENPIEDTIASYSAQREYWKSRSEKAPIKVKRKFERWKDELMKMLTDLSEQLVNDIEKLRREYVDQGISLSRVGMIRLLLKEALAMRLINPDVKSVVDDLRIQYENDLRMRGGAPEDPAAPPDGRRRHVLPDGTVL